MGQNSFHRPTVRLPGAYRYSHRSHESLPGPQRYGATLARVTLAEHGSFLQCKKVAHGTSRTFRNGSLMSAFGGIVWQKSLAQVSKNSAGRRRGFRVKTLGGD